MTGRVGHAILIGSLYRVCFSACRVLCIPMIRSGCRVNEHTFTLYQLVLYLVEYSTSHVLDPWKSES